LHEAGSGEAGAGEAGSGEAGSVERSAVSVKKRKKVKMSPEAFLSRRVSKATCPDAPSKLTLASERRTSMPR